MLYLYVALFPAFLAGFFVGSWWRFNRRSSDLSVNSSSLLMRAGQRIWLLVHTEDLSYLGQARETDGGIEPIGGELGQGWTIPQGAIVRRLRLDDDQILYTVHAERIALMDHRDFDRARRALLVRSAPAFRPGGDSLGALRFVSTVVPLLLALFVAYQLLTLQADLRALSNNTTLLRDTIERGVRVRDE